MAWFAQFTGGNMEMAIVISLTSYLLGCFATGYYLVKWRTGQDIRNSGSGNIGARNVGRALGRSGFLLTFIGDFAKGTLAVWFALCVANDPHQVLLALISVVAGHMWPIQLKFRGGKGISASVGGLLLLPKVLGCFLLLFALVFFLVRKTTLAGMVAYALLPAACYFLHLDGIVITGISILALLVLFAHRRNAVEEITNLFSRPSLSTKTDSSIKKL